MATPTEILAAHDRMEFDLLNAGSEYPSFVEAREAALVEYHTVRAALLARYEELRETSVDIHVRKLHLPEGERNPDWGRHWRTIHPVWESYLWVVNEASNRYRQALAHAYVEAASLSETAA